MQYNSKYHRLKLALDLAKHHINRLLENLKATSLPEKASCLAVPPKTPAFPMGKPKGLRRDHKANGRTENMAAIYAKGFQCGWTSRRRSG